MSNLFLLRSKPLQVGQPQECVGWDSGRFAHGAAFLFSLQKLSAFCHRSPRLPSTRDSIVSPPVHGPTEGEPKHQRKQGAAQFVTGQRPLGQVAHRGRPRGASVALGRGLGMFLYPQGCFWARMGGDSL